MSQHDHIIDNQGMPAARGPDRPRPRPEPLYWTDPDARVWTDPDARVWTDKRTPVEPTPAEENRND